MVRMSDLPDFEVEFLTGVECPTFDSEPWVEGPPLAERRVAMISSAGLSLRGERPFLSGAAGYRALPDTTPPGDVLMSHVSVNYDRSGYLQDINVALPLDRLHELIDEGIVGSAGPAHYSFMGATHPEKMEPKARELAGTLKADGVDSVVLIPV